GFLVAPPPLLEQVVRLRPLSDRQGDQAGECAVAELIEDGELQRHARRMRRVYLARRDALATARRAWLGERVRFVLPPGGMALWLEAPGIDVDLWSARALAAGVSFYPARRFAFDGRTHPYLRLGFAAHSEPELREAVRRLARAIPR